MVEITWQDPPSRGGVRSAQYDQIIEALKGNPGKWALITPVWKTSAAPAAFRQSGCEATTRRNKDGKTWSVYARSPIPKALPRTAAPVAPDKAAVQEAVRKGTALTPPPAAVPRRQETAVKPANDMGLTKFLADRRARGVADSPE